MRYFSAIPVVILFSACSAVPTVKYNKIQGADALTGDEFDSYAFQRSVLKIDAKKDSKGQLITPLEVTVVSAPSEYNDFKVTLTHDDSVGVRTILNITKIDNTDLVKEIGTEVVDSRVDWVNKIGGVIATLAPVAFDATKGLTAKDLPKVINVQPHLKTIAVGGQENVQISGGVIIDFGPLPKDAKPIEQFPTGKSVHSYYYAACRTALVKATVNGHAFSQTVKVSDPRYFQSVGLPAKGKVLMHSECGVSVSSDKDNGIKTTPDIVEALATQGKAIKDALDAAKKDNK